MRVKVTFYVEASDPGDHTGVSSEDYDLITEHVMTCGGEDPQFEKVEDGD